MADGGRCLSKCCNGAPGYINLLDALNGWQLVRELRQALGPARRRRPSSTSARPAPPSACRCRDALRARVLRRERRAVAAGQRVRPRPRRRPRLARTATGSRSATRSTWRRRGCCAARCRDGVIAPGYRARRARDAARQDAAASTPCCASIPAYEPPRSKRARCSGSPSNRSAIPICPRACPPTRRSRNWCSNTPSRIRSAWCSTVRPIGIGAGQQSRIHCTRIACDKADLWYLRQHPSIAAMAWPRDRVERDNAIDEYVRGMALADRRAWLNTLRGVTLGSDAFIPFRDNLDRAAQSGVAHVIQPGRRTT